MRTVHCSGRLSCHAHPPPCMSPAMHASLPHTPPATHVPQTEFLTHACKNITFPTGRIQCEVLTTLPFCFSWIKKFLEQQSKI